MQSHANENDASCKIFHPVVDIISHMRYHNINVNNLEYQLVDKYYSE